MKRLIFALLLLASPAYAQWQVPNHATPTGRGVGVTGFGSAGPGGTDQVLAGNGPASDPSFKPATTMLNAACTLAPSACNFFFGYYSPQWFGALCNGTGDDGPAIQAAINVSGFPNVRLAASCVYRVVTPIVVIKRATITGQGPYVTVIDFEPGANASLFTLGRVGFTTASISLSGILAYSADTTHTKNFIKIIDLASSHIHNVQCAQTNGGGGLWTGNGGSGGSVCLLHQGSFVSTYENLEFYADIPVVFAPNPNSSTFNASDHNEFRDLYLVGTGSAPCIFVQPNIYPAFTQTAFTGRQAWASCFPAFQWASGVTNPSGLSSAGLSFYNVRTEQNGTGGAGTYTFSISLTNGNTLQGLTIENATMESSARGIFLQGVAGATIRNSQKLCGVGAELTLILDVTDNQIYQQNNLWGPTCTVSTTGLTATLVTANPNGGAAPIFGLYTH